MWIAVALLALVLLAVVARWAPGWLRYAAKVETSPYHSHREGVPFRELMTEITRRDREARQARERAAERRFKEAMTEPTRPLAAVA